MKNPIIMVVQMEIVPLRPKENFEKIINYFKLAKKNKCDFIVFPEKCDGLLSPEDYIDENPKRFIQGIKKLCKENEIYCIAGSILEKNGKDYFNTSYLIGRNGELIGKYDKIALAHYGESEYIKAGDKLPVFDTEFGKIGILICRDFLYPKLSNKLAEKGAKIIFCPAFWSYYSNLYEGNDKFLKTNFPIDADIKALKFFPIVRAMENELFFVLCNAAGTYQSKAKIQEGKIISHPALEKLAGHSGVGAPLQGRINSLENYEEGYMIIELDMNLIEDSMFTFSIKKMSPKLSFSSL